MKAVMKRIMLGLYDDCAGCGQVKAEHCTVAADVEGLAEVPVPFCTIACLAAYIMKWDACIYRKAARALHVTVADIR